ncbi:MAG TPA: flagellar basal-body rod protein FlgF [Candidatus Acidoferrum sp.]|nr:flagellar basal-body rod protein FlgF [Candidatus Acidoferrum sp.]
MENSGYIALARQVALDRALDITANNLANLRTSGYKAEKLKFEQFVQQATSPVTPPNEMSSVVQVGTFTDYRPGDFEQTGNTLDFAIQGDGFFAVQDAAGTRYTRAGSFRLDDTGQLVTQDGLPVLDSGGSAIQVPQETRQIIVSGDGKIAADGNVVGEIGVMQFADPKTLVREGNGLYSSSAAPAQATDAKVVQGMIEGANVQPVLEITHMMDILRNFQAAQQMVDSQHEMAMNAINKIAKV